MSFSSAPRVLAAFLIAAAVLPQSARAADDSPERCKGLAGAETVDASEAPYRVISARAVADAGAPARCQVSGYVLPNIGFELSLPERWNGKFMKVGCGGHCGAVMPAACEHSVARGYACVVSDMGHRGGVGDALWAQGNLQAKVDWGYRATHVVALAAKAITQRHYARAPARSYFMGCSTGGRQALQEAQRFPWDFDGIIAGAPPIDLSTIYMTFAWGAQAAHDSSGRALFTAEQLQLVAARATAQCDLSDGVADGVIGDAASCGFDPAQMACRGGSNGECLTPEQVEALRKIYAGPSTSTGLRLSSGGPMPGSEGAWSGVYLGAQDTGMRFLAADGLRNLYLHPEERASWSLADFDFDRDYRRLGQMQVLYDSSNPDLRRFKAAGGKLIVYHGMNDSAVPPRATMDYYDMVERTMGGRAATRDFLRLFMMPGVGHCSGGAGADAADFLSHLEAWVEQGVAPDRILSARIEEKPGAYAYPYRVLAENESAIQFTRPIFPYPARARYSGRGDARDARNYRSTGAE